MKKLKVLLAFPDLHLREPEWLWYDRGINIIDLLVTKVSDLARGSDRFVDYGRRSRC